VRRALAAIVLALVAGCGGDDPPAGIEVRGLTVHSRAVGRDMAVKVAVPEGGGAERPLLVFLHGRGNDEGSYVHEPLLAALTALGRDAPILASPDGAEDTYWHDRASGDWGRSMVREVIPQVARGSATTRSPPRCAQPARTRPCARGRAATTATTGTPTGATTCASTRRRSSAASA
jgi:hypothetical protein